MDLKTVLAFIGRHKAQLSLVLVGLLSAILMLTIGFFRTLLILLLSSVLNALYYIPALVAVWSGRRSDAEKAARDVPASLAMLLLAAGVLFLGVCFRPVMDLIVRGLELI